MMSFEEKDSILRNWVKFLERIMEIHDDAVMWELLEHEQSTKARLRVMMRIYHRANKLRSIRETANIARSAKG